jgi:hypothetical protein
MKSMINLFLFILTYISVHAMVKNIGHDEYFNSVWMPKDLSDTVMLSDGIMDSETV